MNRTKPAKIHTVLRNTILAGVAVIVILTVGAGGQEGLGDMVTMGGFEWLLGDWKVTTDQGMEIRSFFKWGLNKNLINIGFKMGEFEGRGMIYYDPADYKVHQVGVDSRGGVAKGTWDADGDKAVARLEYTPPDGEVIRMASVHSRVDADTMKVEFYEMDKDGWLADEPRDTLQYKRQKKQTEEKEQDDKPVQEFKKY
ncbi:MAG: hypothetical protein JW837_18620 [Sedimentisphaerales bacterium]|nr:hypothetical protein [Sedimentisphaerales bacterium]